MMDFSLFLLRRASDPKHSHACAYILLVLLGNGWRVVGTQFTLIIDAGSTGSRLRIYYRTAYGLTQIIPSRTDEAAFETRPGLSFYAERPSQAGPSLIGLLHAATKYIPFEVQRESNLWVKATGGMRLLNRRQVDSVFAAVENYLQNQTISPFNFAGAEVISGEFEALFGYLAVNHLLHRMNSTEMYGVLDMGGATQQVAFTPNSFIKAGEVQFYMRQRRVSAYAKSYPRFGREAAILRGKEALVKMNPKNLNVYHPCLPNGYREITEVFGRRTTFAGTGNASECSALVHSLLHTNYTCMMPPCALMGDYMSPLAGTFFAISAFYYTVHDLGLVGWHEAKVLSPRQIREATVDACGQKLSSIASTSQFDFREYKVWRCFTGHFILHILLAYNFNEDDTSVTFARELLGHPADWTRGAALFESQYEPLHLQSNTAPCAPEASWGEYRLNDLKTTQPSPCLECQAESRILKICLVVVSTVACVSLGFVIHLSRKQRDIYGKQQQVLHVPFLTNQKCYDAQEGA